MKVVFRIASALLGTLAFLAVALWGASQLPAVQAFLAEKAARIVGPGVHFERVGIVFWPGPGVSLSGIRIAEDDSTDSREALTVDQISLVLDFPSLLDGKVEPKRVSFSGAHLVLRRASDGTLSFSDFVGRFASTVEEDSDELTPSSPGRLPAILGTDSSFLFVDVLVDGSKREVLFEDVTVDIESSQPGEDAGFEAAVALGQGKVRFEGTIHRNLGDPSVLAGAVKADMKGTGLPASTVLYYLLPGDAPENVNGLLDVTAHIDGSVLEDFQATGQLRLASGASFEWIGFEMEAPLRFDLDFGVEESKFSISSGSLRASSVQWKNLKASDLSLQMQYESGGLRFSDVTLAFYGGALDFDGSFRFDDRVAYRGKVEAENVSMTALLTDLTGSTPEVGFDTVATEFEFEGFYADESDSIRNTQGRGHMRLEGGVIPSASVIGAVGGGLLSVVPSVLRPSSQGRLVDPTEIEYLEQNFEIEKGILHVSDLKFVTRDYTLTGAGKIGLDGHVNLSTELDLTIVGMQKLLITTAVPIPKTGVDILPAFPLFVTGTVTDPIFFPDVAKIPFMALQVFFSPVRGVAKVLFGGVRSAGSHLTSWMRPSP